MEFIRGLHNLKPSEHGCVASIGNFDGVHLGHQKIIARLKQESERLGLPTTLVIFEPQPREYFGGDKAPARLSRLREKLVLFEQQGIDRVLCLPFNATTAGLSADDFIQKVLIDGLNIRFLVVGDDFRFGKNREGTLRHLEQAGKQAGFIAMAMPAINLNEQRISSSQIRLALQQGDFATANEFLGRPYSMIGRVVQGDKRGREIGVHTANIHLHRKHSPLAGVFVVKVHGIGDHELRGVANIGRRPTVGGKRLQLEVHIFDFSADIYGSIIKVEFLTKLRDEQCFKDFSSLKQQINSDIEQAKQYIATMSN